MGHGGRGEHLLLCIFYLYLISLGRAGYFAKRKNWASQAPANGRHLTAGKGRLSKQHQLWTAVLCVHGAISMVGQGVEQLPLPLEL